MGTEELNASTTMSAQGKTGRATASMVLGIIGLFAWLIPIIGAPVTIVGLVLGFKGLNTSKKTYAIVGITLCILGIILTIINASIGAYLGATRQL